MTKKYNYDELTPFQKKVYDEIDAITDGRAHPTYDELEEIAVRKYGDDRISFYVPEFEIKDTIRDMIKGNTNLQDIINEISKQDQKNINYLADYMAKYPGAWRPDNMSKDNKVKALAVSLVIYDKSTGASKNRLKSELLRTRIGHYRGEGRKEMLDLFQKAKKMLKGEIDEDVTVKGLTRKSYTRNSSLNKAVEENGNSDIKEEILRDNLTRNILAGSLIGGLAVVGAGMTTVYAFDKHLHQQNPEDSKNKKEVVIPADKKNVIEVEGDISDAQAVELVNKYKKEQTAKNGNTDQNQKGQTYYIVVKNSKGQNR